MDTNNEKLLSIIVRLVEQDCEEQDGILWSKGIHIYGEAIRVLAECGVVKMNGVDPYIEARWMKPKGQV